MMKNLNWKELLEFRLVVMCGLPGSGKSYLAKKIARMFGMKYLNSDELRKRLHGTIRHDTVGDVVVMKQSNDLMSVLYDEAISLLGQGERVVVDATHLRKERLVQIERVKTHTKLIVILVVHAEEGVVRRWAREHGMNTNGESAEDAVMRVRGYFEERYKHGEWTWPSAEMDGVKVMEVWNE